MPRVELRTYLRILSCAAAAGLYFSVGVVALVLFVNPHLPITPGILAHMVVFLVPVYGAGATLLLAGSTALLQPFLLVPTSRRHFDPVLTARYLLVVLAAWAAIFWGNAGYVAALLSPRQERHLLRGTLVLTVAFGLALAAHAVQRLLPRRRHGARLFLLLVALATPWALFSQRKVSHTPVRRHTLVLDLDAARVPMRILAVDGLSLDQLRPLEARGLLPNLGRMLAEGASARLRTISPTKPPVAWTTVATGKMPFRHGISDDSVFYLAGSEDPIRITPRYVLFRSIRRLSLLNAAPVLRTDRQALAWWNILSRARMSVGVINWPVTYPAERTLRLMVTDYLTTPYFQFGTALARVTHPERLEPLVLRHRLAPDDIPDALLEALAPASGPPGASDEALLDRLREARALDGTSRSLGLMFALDAPDVLAIRFAGLEIVARYFLRYHAPEAFGNVAASEQERFGRVVASHYGYLDDIAGEMMRGLPEGGILLVVSAYGMEPRTGLERLLSLSSDALATATRDGGADGAILLWGGPIARGVTVEPRQLADVAPTILYAEGLPWARDMDGDPIFEAFTEEHVSRHPLLTIESYEAARVPPVSLSLDPQGR